MQGKTGYFVGKLIELVVTLFLVSLLVFIAFSIIPGALGKDDEMFVGDIDIASIAEDLNNGN